MNFLSIYQSIYLLGSSLFKHIPDFYLFGWFDFKRVLKNVFLDVPQFKYQSIYLFLR